MNDIAQQAKTESAWSIKLKSSLQSQTTLKSSVLTTQQENTRLLEEMIYFKPRLIEAIKNKDKEKIVKYSDIICNLRIRLAINNLKRGQEQFGRLSESAVKMETKNFVTECHKLSLAVSQILQT